MTTTFRERIEGMPEGLSIGDNFGTFSHIFGAGLDGEPYVVANCRASLTFKTASNPERDKAVAAGFLLSVATARLVASDEAVEMVARAIDPEAWKAADAMGGYPMVILDFLRPSLEAARRVLSAIQAAAMEGK